MGVMNLVKIANSLKEKGDLEGVRRIEAILSRMDKHAFEMRQDSSNEAILNRIRCFAILNPYKDDRWFGPYELSSGIYSKTPSLTSKKYQTPIDPITKKEIDPTDNLKTYVKDLGTTVDQFKAPLTDINKTDEYKDIFEKKIQNIVDFAVRSLFAKVKESFVTPFKDDEGNVQEPPSVGGPLIPIPGWGKSEPYKYRYILFKYGQVPGGRRSDKGNVAMIFDEIRRIVRRIMSRRSILANIVAVDDNLLKTHVPSAEEAQDWISRIDDMIRDEYERSRQNDLQTKGNTILPLWEEFSSRPDFPNKLSKLRQNYFKKFIERIFNYGEVGVKNRKTKVTEFSPKIDMTTINDAFLLTNDLMKLHDFGTSNWQESLNRKVAEWMYIKINDISKEIADKIALLDNEIATMEGRNSTNTKTYQDLQEKRDEEVKIKDYFKNIPKPPQDPQQLNQYLDDGLIILNQYMASMESTKRNYLRFTTPNEAYIYFNGSPFTQGWMAISKYETPYFTRNKSRRQEGNQYKEYFDGLSSEREWRDITTRPIKVFIDLFKKDPNLISLIQSVLVIGGDGREMGEKANYEPQPYPESMKSMRDLTTANIQIASNRYFKFPGPGDEFEFDPDNAESKAEEACRIISKHLRHGVFDSLITPLSNIGPSKSNENNTGIEAGRGKGLSKRAIDVSNLFDDIDINDAKEIIKEEDIATQPAQPTRSNTSQSIKELTVNEDWKARVEKETNQQFKDYILGSVDLVEPEIPQTPQTPQPALENQDIGEENDPFHDMFASGITDEQISQTMPNSSEPISELPQLTTEPESDMDLDIGLDLPETPTLPTIEQPSDLGFGDEEEEDEDDDDLGFGDEDEENDDDNLRGLFTDSSYEHGLRKTAQTSEGLLYVNADGKVFDNLVDLMITPPEDIPQEFKQEATVFIENLAKVIEEELNNVGNFDDEIAEEVKNETQVLDFPQDVALEYDVDEDFDTYPELFQEELAAAASKKSCDDLVQLANKLDNKGFTKAADLIDKLIRKISSGTGS